eukprot:TRINITY_DN1004_c0_g1_i1.p1 TRINITY_DN1004_c0_g1~~TRINITY_DN1004_c0_g1_i1.p1  ORF type:complete len:491 (-),score=264.33 TRINITY_DN1004_c0_g1_i1:88-1467(-)
MRTFVSLLGLAAAAGVALGDSATPHVRSRTLGGDTAAALPMTGDVRLDGELAKVDGVVRALDEAVRNAAHHMKQKGGALALSDASAASTADASNSGENDGTALSSTLSTGDIVIPEIPHDIQQMIPEGLPRTRAALQRAFESASLSVTLPARTIAGPGYELKIAANTRVSVSIRAGYSPGVSVSFRPHLVVDKDWVPVSVRVSSLEWSFATAQYTVRAEGTGPDSLYSWISSKVANSKFREFVPPRMRRAGYNPARDSNLEATIAELQAAAAAGSSGDSSTSLADLSAASVSTTFRLSSEVHLNIAEHNAEINIPAHLGVSLSASTTGRLTAPRLSRAAIGLQGAGIEIKKSDGAFAELAGIDLRSIALLPGARLALEYDMHAAGVMQGLTALAGIVALAGGDARGAELVNARAPRLQAVRDLIDRKVNEVAGPQIRAMIKAYDPMVPGFSLVRVFGIE